jgi:heme-binding protein
MKMSAKTVRRGLYGMFAGGLLAFGSAAIVAPVANAQPVTDTDTCSVSGIATTSSTVSASTSTYLASHPETKNALTRIVTQSPAEPTEAFRAYFAQNPQVGSELKTIHQPVLDLSNQCGIEVTPTPLTEALTAA